MSDKAFTFYNAPIGTSSRTRPAAAISTVKTSEALVSSAHADAFYFRALERSGMNLNAPQIEAVRHGEGPALVLAGAGSGKTSMLVSRTGYLIAVRKVDPRRILLVTFTTKAAQEMKHRIAQLPGIDAADAHHVQAKTFHALFLQLLRGRGYQERILSSERHKQIAIKLIMKRAGIQDDVLSEDVLSVISSYKLQLLGPEQVPDDTKEEKELQMLYREYEHWKKGQHMIDFDDILIYTYRLLQSDQELLAMLQNRFEYMMVDEFQDTNQIQYELIQMIAASHENLLVCGDDDQTIYSFNGANHQFILDFDKVYPNANVFTLDINYRSTPGIVGLGNAVIVHNTERRDKTLMAAKVGEGIPQFFSPRDAEEEAERIRLEIVSAVKEGRRRFSDFAVLFRTTHYSRAIFEQLVMHDVLFHVKAGEQFFYELSAVKMLIDHLRLSVNPKNMEAIEHILPTLYVKRELGIEHIKLKNREQPKKYPLIHLKALPDRKGYQNEQLLERMKLIKRLKEMRPAEAIRELRKQFFDDYMETAGSQSSSYKENIKESLDELVFSAERFESADEFLQFVDEMLARHRQLKESPPDQDADAVSLLTIHSAKGLEFPIVFIIGASEHMLPHYSAIQADQLNDQQYEGKNRSFAAIEEERRLMYVAITRAKEELYISSPRLLRGKKAELSRFLRQVYASEQPRNSSQPVRA